VASSEREERHVAAAALFYPTTLADLVGVVLVLGFPIWRWRLAPLPTKR
jgi:hypothetical protein